jgi:hypothetical protein
MHIPRNIRDRRDNRVIHSPYLYGSSEVSVDLKFIVLSFRCALSDHVSRSYADSQRVC